MSKPSLTFQVPPRIAVGIGALTPDPGGINAAGSVAWSTTLAALVVWSGSAWQLVNADRWTYTRLLTDFSTSSTTAVAVASLAFTPQPNSTYEFRAGLLTRTDNTASGVRPGLIWPTSGILDKTAKITATNNNNSSSEVIENTNTNTFATATAMPDAITSWPATVMGTLVTGATPVGTLGLSLASERAVNTATFKAGSWLGFRAIP